MQNNRLKTSTVKGTNYPEIYKKAFNFYKTIKAKSKRRPYVRSKYFENQKIFLELFWIHLHQKNKNERERRVSLFPVAVEFISNSKSEPILTAKGVKSSEIFYRFTAVTKDNQIFFIQIKENKKSGQKWLMSIFPEK